MTDTDRIDILEEMMEKGENIVLNQSTRKEGPINMFTIVTQHIYGHRVRDLLDYLAGEWVAAGRKPDPWARRKRAWGIEKREDI